jgi:quercetin dioxygenase-like cupin family protein
MKIISADDLQGTDREVKCPGGGFTSLRFLLERDGTGYTLTKTVVPKGSPQHWHYPHHVETCFCVEGHGILINSQTGDKFDITPGTAYVLDGHEPHSFEALVDTTLLCVFNPPLTGREVHDETTRSYPPSDVGFRSPVYNVRRVSIDKVRANDYNPNAVAPPEMALLETSIWEDGYTQPVVTYYDRDNDTYIVVDGFHRYLTLKNSPRIFEREQGMLPVVVIDKQLGDRMASTIRHNRARGTHSIDLMSNIVSELVEMGKSDRWICKHVGMSPDELLRMKQITGVAALFTNQDFSESWDAELD